MNYWLAAYLIGFVAMLACNIAWILAAGKSGAECSAPGRLFRLAVIWPISMLIPVEKNKD